MSEHEDDKKALSSSTVVAALKKRVEKGPNLSVQDHRDVYSFIESYVAPAVNLRTKMPPLEVYTYAIRNILYPEVDSEALPMMLDILSSLEALRHFTLGQARRAIVFHDFYRKTGQLKERRSKEDEVEQLRSLSSPANDKEARAFYIFLVRTVCKAIVYRTWTGNKDGRDAVADTLVELNSLFPRLNPSYRQTSPRLFHADLSEEERCMIEEDGEDCYDFIQESISWVQERASDQPIDADLSRWFSRADFVEAHPPIEDVDLVRYTMTYMTSVTSVVVSVKTVMRNKTA